MRASVVALFAGALAMTSCGRSGTAGGAADQSNARNVAMSEPHSVENGAGAHLDAMPTRDALAAPIRAALAAEGGLDDQSRALIGDADLDGDGTPEALVYLIGPTHCGTGGCSLYVLGEQSGKWVVLDEIGPSQLPIYKLPSSSGGWADLGISIFGGGAKAALMKVPHGTGGYATNPTVAPASTTTADGAIMLIADDYDKAEPFR
jgi:hypothetical protein